MSLQDDLKDKIDDATVGRNLIIDPFVQQTVAAESDDAVGVEQHEAKVSFVIDTQGTPSNLIDLPPPHIRSLSPTPSDSSEEVILFAGRDQAGRGIRRIQSPNHRHLPDPYDSRIKIIEDKIEAQKIMLAAATADHEEYISQRGQRKAKIVSMSIDPRLAHVATGENLKTSPSGGAKASDYMSSVRQHRSRKYNKRAEEQAVIDDYIANMEDEELDQMGSYNTRELGGAESDIWVDTDASTKSTQRKAANIGWGREELCDFDDLSTSDGMLGSVQAILSKRRRKTGYQYLVVWEGQGIDEARWIPVSNLNESNVVKLIEGFEAEEKLVAEIMEDEDDSDSESDDDLLSHGGSDDDDLDEVDLLQRKIDRMTDEKIAKLLAKQEELGMGSAELMLFDDSVDEEVEMDEMVRFGAQKRSRSKKGVPKQVVFKRPRGEFLAANSLADAYDGFDVMDFERPSLRKKPKGRKGKLVFDLSDSELEDSMQLAWDNDRLKKKEKKEEREELRAQGLLGKKNGKPDLKAKYHEGMGIRAVKEEIKGFLKSDNSTYVDTFLFSDCLQLTHLHPFAPQN
jgi:hypothetical protein